jgi:hypothetical protein
MYRVENSSGLGRFAVALAALVCVTALQACARTPSSPDTSVERQAREFEPTGTDCIQHRSISRYEKLDTRNLIIYAAGGRAYHVQLANPSQNLRYEYRIDILDYDGRICPYSGDSVVIRGPFTEQIPIIRIDALADDEVDELKNQFGVLDSDDI